ncbi:MAG: PAS domain-containing sensor histidine kinase [Prevotella sp.]|nr:PAS domain-containing sensor histidine kinase [Prevotella sp.]
MSLWSLQHYVLCVVVVLVVVILVVVAYNWVYLKRTREANVRQKEQNAHLALVLFAGRLRIWKYLPATRHYLFLSEEGSMEQRYNPIDFAQFFDRDDFETLRSTIFDICEGKRNSAVVTLVSNAKDDAFLRHYEVTVSVDRRDVNGHVTSILGIQHDVTEEYRRLESVNQLLLRYHTVFNSSLIDVVYYDGQGVLRDINERACKAFGVSDRNFVLQNEFLLKNNPIFADVDIETMNNIRTSSIVNFQNYEDPIYHLDEFGLTNKKMYYDSTINPIRDANGKLVGVYMAGRDITEMVVSYHRQKEGAEKLGKVNESIQNYISNINYALRITNIRIVNYYPKSFTLEMSDDITQSQMRLSQLRCIRLATPRFRRTVSSVLNRMDHLSPYNINVNIETEIRDKKGRQIWLLFNMVPMLDANGKVERYYGLCREMTDMVEMENRLVVETKKAQETELLKQSFLSNMSYEIRTPLNNVVGFAGLFNAPHDEADEPAFVEQIKTNSNNMLTLVNDVMLLSSLDANMVEYRKEFIDFAQVFASHCQMGWSNASPQVKTIIDNPYDSLVINIDEEHLGKVIQKLCWMSALTLKEGFAKARCEYRRGELLITIEDTGDGIPEEGMAHLFDRFVHTLDDQLLGTGLDLPIVQALVRQMGGTIELDSKLHKGTTAWVSIPCEVQSVERRREEITSDTTENILL